MPDRILRCVECGKEFPFTEGEQRFYEQKGFAPPRRCGACRAANKQRRENAKRAEGQRCFEQAFAQEPQMSGFTPDPADTLYIIGNGFDLAHGVPSSYYNFRDSMGKRNELRETLETYLRADDIWADFEQALAAIRLDRMYEAVPVFMDDFNAYAPDAQAADYFASIENAMEPAQTITDALPRAFRRWVESLKLPAAAKPYQNLITSGKVLCFNYTEFIETLYGVPRENVCYIHGCRRVEKGKPKEELILGHLPDAGDWGGVQPRLPRFRRNPYKRAMLENAMSTASQYAAWYDEATTKNCGEILRKHRAFFDALGGVRRIVSIGHSLSPVDWAYFREVQARAAPDAAWCFSAHSARDLDSIHRFTKELSIQNWCVFKS